MCRAGDWLECRCFNLGTERQIRGLPLVCTNIYTYIHTSIYLYIYIPVNAPRRRQAHAMGPQFRDTTED